MPNDRIDGAEWIENGAVFGHYKLSSSPWRKVWHTTEVVPSNVDGARRMAATHPNPPHLWAWPEHDWVAQTVPLTLSARALFHNGDEPETNHRHAIQTEVIALARDAPLSDPSVADWLGRRVLGPVLKAGVPIDVNNVAPSTGSGGYGHNGAVRQSWDWWTSFDGQCGHANVPGNEHWDPGVANYPRIAQAAKPGGPKTSPEEGDMFLYTAPGKPVFYCVGDKSVGLNEATDLQAIRKAHVDVGRPIPTYVLDDDTFNKFRERYPGS
jgi:hypothetical protein